MAERPDLLSERFHGFSRRSMFATLVVVIVLGSTGLGLILSTPGAVKGHLVGWLIPVAIAILVAVTTSILSRRWASDSPEVRMIEQDEWRRTNMASAMRGALIVVLSAQWPLGLALGSITRLAPFRAAMAMATSTIALGLVTLIGLFLYFDRE